MIAQSIVFILFGVLVVVLGVRVAAEGGNRAARALKEGRAVTAQVVRTEAGGTTKYQPYNAYPPSLCVRYELDGKTREGTLWLEKSRHTDYQVGQTLQVYVSGSHIRRLRTMREASTYGNGWEAGGLLLILFGLVAVIAGIVSIVRGP
ncbi:DUF3592 domain-containing protein [Streptacidiphilus sp. EB103A]|uniref:DUF3592 domain-containing protein n=1 Tax=Streptacidiphilus sp. EB103A TaxID=3156275 RepID=UPI003511B49D